MKRKLLALVLSIAAALSSLPASAQLLVPPAQPVAVKGTVDARQSGAWNVGITGTPAVRVIDRRTPVTIPMPRDPSSGGSTPFSVVYEVPEGMRLVIEYANLQLMPSCVPPNNICSRGTLNIQQASNVQTLYLPAIERLENSIIGSYAIFSQPVRAVAERPAGSPPVRVQYIGILGVAPVDIAGASISGYLEPL